MATYGKRPSGGGGGGGEAVGACGVWPAAQYDFIHGLMPALTGFQYLPAAQLPMGGAVPSTNDGAMEGGGRTFTSNTGCWISGSVFQTCKTGQGAFSFKVKFLAAGAGQLNAVGLSNAAGDHDLLIGPYNTVSATNYVMLVDGAVSTSDDLGVANDLGVHTFTVTFDATNIKVYFDNNPTPIKTRAITTNLVDEPMYLFIFNTVSGETVWTEVVYAFVSP